MDLANIISDFIDDPFKFLIGFVMLLVPSSLFVWLLIGGELLKETGHNFIGTALIFILDAFGNLTLWLVTTFIESVVYLVIIVFLIGTVLSALGIKK
jgi:hypothetical protein